MAYLYDRDKGEEVLALPIWQSLQASNVAPAGVRAAFAKKLLLRAGKADKLAIMEIEPFSTAEAAGFPTITQQSVFIENRVGQLLRLTRLFDQTDIRILAVSVVYSVDCAICRMILDDPDRANEVFRDHRFSVSECELLVVSLPHGKRALLHTWAALLGAEVNIHYTYPMLVQPQGCAALAILPDNVEMAADVLRGRGFELLSQQDLLDERHDLD